MTKSYLTLSLLSLLVLIISSCSKESDDTTPDISVVDMVTIEGNITIPNIESIDLNTLSVVSALAEGTIEETTTGLTYSIIVNTDEVQLISLLVGESLLCMSLIEEGISESYELSPSSMAKALILTNPFLVSSDKAEVSLIESIIKNDVHYNSYVEAIENAITNGGFLLETIIEELQEISTSVFDTYFNEGIFSDKGLDTLNVNYPAGQFQLSNRRRRWLTTIVTTENSSISQPLAIQYDGTSNNSIYVESASTFNNLFDGVITNILSVDNPDNQPLVVSCYGFGKNIPEIGTEEWNLGFEAAMHTVFYDIVLETASILAGISKSTVKDLRGRPNKGSTVLNKLFDSLREKMLTREGEIYLSLQNNNTEELLNILKEESWNTFTDVDNQKLWLDALKAIGLNGGWVSSVIKTIFPLLKAVSLTIKASDAVFLVKSITQEDWETKFILRDAEQEFKIEGNVNIATQQEFDELFSVNIVLIEGNLVIDSENSNDPVNNLEGLANLRKVEGDFIIKNTTTTELPGFEQLEEVSDHFEISQNNLLEKLTGFNVLRNSKGYFGILNNQTLNEISGFDNLQRVTDNLVISGNTSLRTLNGFNALQEVGGDFQWITVQGNALIELDAFNAIVDTPITIEEENELSIIQGYRSLKRARHFKIKNCAILSDLSNFSKLESVIQNFELTGLDIINTNDFISLNQLSGSESTLNFRIKDNEKLEDVCKISDVLISSMSNINNYEMTGNNNNFTQEELLTGVCN